MPIYKVNRRKRKKNGLSKKMAERSHCKSRANERFGVVFTSKIRILTIKAIQNREGTFVEKKSNRVSVWKNVVPGYPDMVVAYDKKRMEIITVFDKRTDSVDVTPVKA